MKHVHVRPNETTPAFAQTPTTKQIPVRPGDESSVAAGRVRPQSAAIIIRRVRSILKARRRRAEFFQQSLFADAAWDMLLELYAAELSQHRMSVTALCIGANVPHTTALRRMKRLEKLGLVRRSADPMDGRRIFVGITPKAFDAMEALFAATPQDELLI